MRLLLLFLLFFHSPTGSAAGRTGITIGFNPAENASLVESNGKRLSDYLKKKTGLRVATYVAEDYDALVDALRQGKVDFAFLPPFSYVKAEDTADGKLLLKAVRKGQAVYYGAIIVRTDSGIQNVEDLKGKTIAWVDRSSATGFVVPQAVLIEKKGIKPSSFFGKQVFLGAHDAVVQAVFRKEADAGATWINDEQGKKSAWSLYLRKPEELRQIRIILISDPIPGDALTTSGKLMKKEPEMVRKVTKVLQRMGEATDGQQILRDLYGIDKMVPAYSKDFESVRRASRISRQK